MARPLRQGAGRGAREQLHLFAGGRLQRARPWPGHQRLLRSDLPGPDRHRSHRSHRRWPGAADREPAERQPGRDQLAARCRRPAQLAGRQRRRRPGRSARRVRLRTDDQGRGRGRLANRPTAGRVPDRRGHALRQALRRRPGRRGDPQRRPGRPGPAQRAAERHRRRPAGHRDPARDRPADRRRAPPPDRRRDLRPGLPHPAPACRPSRAHRSPTPKPFGGTCWPGCSW